MVRWWGTWCIHSARVVGARWWELRQQVHNISVTSGGHTFVHLGPRVGGLNWWFWRAGLVGVGMSHEYGNRNGWWLWVWPWNVGCRCPWKWQVHKSKWWVAVPKSWVVWGWKQKRQWCWTRQAQVGVGAQWDDQTENEYDYRDASPQCRVEVPMRWWNLRPETKYNHGDASPQHRVEVPMRLLDWEQNTTMGMHPHSIRWRCPWELSVGKLPSWVWVHYPIEPLGAMVSSGSHSHHQMTMYQTLKRGNPQRQWWQAARNLYGKLSYLWTWLRNPESTLAQPHQQHIKAMEQTPRYLHVECQFTTWDTGEGISCPFCCFITPCDTDRAHESYEGLYLMSYWPSQESEWYALLCRSCAEPGIAAWDCKYQESVVLCPYSLFLAGDNPMQAEECSHAGLKCNYFCRTCNIGGATNFKELDKG